MTSTTISTAMIVITTSLVTAKKTSTGQDCSLGAKPATARYTFGTMNAQIER
jgi:hypothetical protein